MKKWGYLVTPDKSSESRPDYPGPERRQRQTVYLTEEQIDLIAERAAARALQNFYLEVGKVTVRSMLYIIGAIGIAALTYFGLIEKTHDVARLLK